MRPRIDSGRAIDWGHTSKDYASFRPGPPDDFYVKLEAFGIGGKGQRVLDLGTGTGLIARNLAKRGAVVAGFDIAEASLETAKALALQDGLTIEFKLAPAEEPPFPDRTFDVATANQCFNYFDLEKTLAALRRVLKPRGALMIGNFNWLPREDETVAKTEQLILKHNPEWKDAGFDGNFEHGPAWLPEDLKLESQFIYNLDMPFTREGWRGRIRASRGIGATLSAEAVAAFDAELEDILVKSFAPEFKIKHRIDARVFRFV